MKTPSNMSTRQFASWRNRHRLSLTQVSAVLGVSRRQVAFYLSGETDVPRWVELRCRDIDKAGITDDALVRLLDEQERSKAHV